jgi:hypothetical protein
MDNQVRIQLHPAISWQQFDQNHLQIRVPDGQHITLTEHCAVVDSLMNYLTKPKSLDDTLTWGHTNAIEEEVLHGALSTLHQYSIVVETDTLSVDAVSGEFFKFTDFYAQTSRSLRRGLPAPYFSSITVLGQGVIQDAVRDVVEQLALPVAQASPLPRPALRILCSDHGDQQYLREQNRLAHDAGEALLVIQFVEERFSIGPLYIPKESACYECFTLRKRAASSFLPELLGLQQQPAKRSADVGSDIVFNNLIKYAVGRYLSIVNNGMFHIIKPNEVETWDLLKAERHVGEVLQVPRCDVCGLKKHSDPVRAIRDLNS